VCLPIYVDVSFDQSLFGCVFVAVSRFSDYRQVPDRGRADRSLFQPGRSNFSQWFDIHTSLLLFLSECSCHAGEMCERMLARRTDGVIDDVSDIFIDMVH
jgi:hypothetical protein